MFDWPHSPPHRFANNGTYFVTAGTYLKRHYFRQVEDLDRLLTLLLSLSREHDIALEAWSIFSNHYHMVARGAGEALRLMIAQLHSLSAREVNARENVADRKVWFQCYDTELTYERSWLARLKYTQENPVKHGLVLNAANYRWCSAGWFERNAGRGFVHTLQRFRLDRIKIDDEFDVLPVDGF